jgi:MFS family permease
VDSRRWVMLALGMVAQASSCVFLYGLPYLLPLIRTELHLSLSQASTLIAFPTIGLLLALVAWGAAADHYGERIVMTAGLLIAAVFLVAAAELANADASRPALAVLLLLAGVGGASINAASGRLVLGWFGPRDRGLAMGARQTAQPLGTALAAAALPALGQAHGFRGALLGCAALCAASGVAVGLFAADPPRRARPEDEPVGGSPYRTSFLWRVHLASACMVVPQFAVTAFAFEFLTSQRDWSSSHASTVLAIGNLAGAAVRLAVGAWSDRAGSRLRPMRTLALATTAVVGLVAVGAKTGTALGPVALVVGAAVTVATNGLAFTAVAERAGPRWAGRALGTQNTGQNLVAAVTSPALGTLIEHSGYAMAFVVAAGFSLGGAAATPVREETPLG